MINSHPHLQCNSESIFTNFEFQKGKKFEVESEGKFFNPKEKEAVIGSFVARQTGLKVGDVFQPYHGLIFSEDAQHDDDYKVVGVL